MSKKEMPRQWWETRKEIIEPLKPRQTIRTPGEPTNWSPKNSTEADRALALHKKGGPINKTDKNEWMKEAECLGLAPEIMLPHRRDTLAIEYAKSICRSCVVIDECLEATLSDTEQTGIMGGMTNNERKAYRAEN